MLVDELHRIVRSIYDSPLKVTEGKIGQDNDCGRITVECDKMWSHCRNEPTSDRYGMLIISDESIMVRWSPPDKGGGTSYMMDFLLPDPTCVRDALELMHTQIIDKLSATVDKMSYRQKLESRMDQINQLIPILDLRYIQVLTREEILEQADSFTIKSDISEARHYKKQDYEKHHPLWWPGDSSRFSDECC